MSFKRGPRKNECKARCELANSKATIEVLAIPTGWTTANTDLALTPVTLLTGFAFPNRTLSSPLLDNYSIQAGAP